MAKERLFHIGVKAMVLNPAGQILLMHEDASTHSMPTDNYWDLPGGRIIEGESEIEALKREVAEETGITKLSDIEFDTATISNHQIKMPDGTMVGIALFVYKVKLDHTRELRLSEEHLGYEWVDIAEAKKRLRHKYPKEFTDRL